MERQPKPDVRNESCVFQERKISSNTQYPKILINQRLGVTLEGVVGWPKAPAWSRTRIESNQFVPIWTRMENSSEWVMPMWRNGRRGWLRTSCLYGVGVRIPLSAPF